MADVPRANRPLSELLGDPPVIRWTTRYLKRLLIERAGIRAQLENPGGSIILMASEKLEETGGYSPVIGNDLHLDLIEAEDEVSSLPVSDQIALLRWIDGLTTKQIEDYLIARGPVRKRESSDRHARRRVADMVESLNAREDS